MKLTDVAAWWGATVATLVLLWDVYKWRKRGADVSVKAVPNVKFVPALPSGERPYIMVTVANNGGQATTITNVTGVHYPSLWRRVLRISGTYLAAPLQIPGTPPLPHVLAPGTQWRGMIDQALVVKEHGTAGYLYCGVEHSASKRPVHRRVRLAAQE